jgi:hypothetical protein
MPNSTSIIDYFASGLAANRPTSCPISPLAVGLYWATDTQILSTYSNGVWSNISNTGLAGPQGAPGAVPSVVGQTGAVTASQIASALGLTAPATAPFGTTTNTVADGGVQASQGIGITANASALAAETTRAEAAEALLVLTSKIGAVNGVAPLDGSARVPLTNLPVALSEAIYFAGTWNASTNTPTLASGSGSAGAMYKVSSAGTTALDGISQWNVGDQAVFSGATSTWNKIDGVANEVTSVAGQTGAITAGQIATALGLTPAATAAFGTGLGTVAQGNDSRIVGAAQVANNLSDLASAATARTNLGLGGAAVLNVGTASGTVGDGGILNTAVTNIASNTTQINTINSEITTINTTLGNTPLLTTPNSFQKTVSGTPQSVAYASTITLDLTQGNNVIVGTLTGNVASFANPSAMTPGSSGWIKLTQDGTGSRTVTAWGSYFKFGPQGTPVLSTAAGAVDVLFYNVIDAARIVLLPMTGVT